MAKKYDHAGRPTLEWTYTYQDLCRITGKSLNTVQASKRRPGGFDPSDLLSVFYWLCRNATDDIKIQAMQHMASIPVKIETRPRKRRAGA